MLSRQAYGVVIFGFIEICFGLITLIAVITSIILGKSKKPVEVLSFVLTTSIISLGLGIGILKRNLTSYHLLLFFAAVIILSKVLIFAKIIILTSALETSIPSEVKNTISPIYHSLLIWYFLKPKIKRQFVEKDDARASF